MGGPFDECESIVEVLGQLAGAASVCWRPLTKEEADENDGDQENRVFDSERAEMFVTLANERIKEIIKRDREKEFSPYHPL